MENVYAVFQRWVYPDGTEYTSCEGAWRSVERANSVRDEQLAAARLSEEQIARGCSAYVLPITIRED